MLVLLSFTHPAVQVDAHPAVQVDAHPALIYSVFWLTYAETQIAGLYALRAAHTHTHTHTNTHTPMNTLLLPAEAVGYLGSVLSVLAQMQTLHTAAGALRCWRGPSLVCVLCMLVMQAAQGPWASVLGE